MNQDLLICARCQATLTPGSGRLWEVRIHAVADPWPPEFTEEDLQRDVQREWSEVIEQMRDLSPLEAMDQVHRHTIIHLCNRCFDKWYEDPTG